MERAATTPQASVRPERLRYAARLRRPAALCVGILLALVLGIQAGLAGAGALGYGVVIALDGARDAVPAGQLVLGHQVDARQVRPGDVIVVQQGVERGSGIAIRRVASLHPANGEILARIAGDPNLYVLADHVVAPSRSIPYLGFLAAAFTTPLGWLLGLGLPASLVSWLALRRIWVPRA
jgi:hypothetical protein